MQLWDQFTFLWQIPTKFNWVQHQDESTEWRTLLFIKISFGSRPLWKCYENFSFLFGFEAINAIKLWQRLGYRAANWISFSEIKSIFTHPLPTLKFSLRKFAGNSVYSLLSHLRIAHASFKIILSLEMALSAYFSWYSEIIWRTQG